MGNCTLPTTGSATWVIAVIAVAAIVGGVVAMRLGRRGALPVVLAVAVAIGTIALATPARAASGCPPPTTTAPPTSPAPTSSTTTTTAPSSTTIDSTTSTTSTSTSTTSTSTTTSSTTTSSTTTSSTTTTVVEEVGSLRISKLIDDPNGGYVGGSGKTFAGAYDCGTGATGTFTALTRVSPVTISDIPAGRTCVVTETTPTGGLLNASFAWDTPLVAPSSIAIVADTTADVTITNRVIQRFGPLTVAVEVDGPGGYTGGTARVFTASYSCTLTNGPSLSGTVAPTPATPATAPTPIPAGSSCTVTMVLTNEPGDFAGPENDWAGAVANPSPVAIAATVGGSTTVTASYTLNIP